MEYIAGPATIPSSTRRNEREFTRRKRLCHGDREGADVDPASTPHRRAGAHPPSPAARGFSIFSLVAPCRQGASAPQCVSVFPKRNTSRCRIIRKGAPMTDDTIRNEARSLIGTVTDIRRDLHRHPELGFREIRTAKKISELLSDLGIEHRTGVAETGILATIRGAGAGKTVALRADMDALPIDERTENPARSETPGVMHACGHDGHVAILLGAAAILQKSRGEFAGTVRLAFQPAEEGLGGAIPLLEQGALEDPSADAAFALHIWNSTPAGRIALAPGPVMAAAAMAASRRRPSIPWSVPRRS